MINPRGKADPRRWTFQEKPVALKIINPVIHPIITNFDQFEQTQKEILYEIKQTIVGIIGDCEVSIFGSRINGNWTEESDYDLLVYSTTVNTPKRFDKENFKVKVDIFFLQKSL